MNQRAAYLLQILDKIGTPLINAVTHVSVTKPDEDAKAVAALLSKTVQASIDLGNIIDINPAEAQDDSLRVGLAGLAGPLVAENYRAKKGAPAEGDLKKIIESLQAVLTFSDNFAPDENNTQRLENVSAQGHSVDPHQTTIQYINAFLPVVQAISVFPFGQAEQKLITDVTDRLIKRAAEMREALVPALPPTEQKHFELAFLDSLAKLYSTCHMQETEKAMKMDAESQGSVSIESVWAGFDLRASMLEALVRNLGPEDSAQPAAASAAPPPPLSPIEVTPPAQAPSTGAADTQTPAQTQPPITPPAAPPAAPPAETQPPQAPIEPPIEQAQTPANPAPPAGGNPMAMFAKKPNDEETQNTPPTAPPAAPPVTPPAETQPPQAPPPAAPITPPAEEPPAEPPMPPASESDESSDSGEQGSGGGGGPMSFFKKGDS